MSTTADIYRYLTQFLIQNNWDYEYTKNQARALWTSYCLIGGMDADSFFYDNDLLLLYDNAMLEELVTYENFNNFMTEYVV